MKKQLLFILALCLTHLTSSQTLMPIPAHNTTYDSGSNYPRGYYFTAPIDFVIKGLRVPTDASSAPQYIQIFKTNGPIQTTGTASNLTLLGKYDNISGTAIINTNISVSSGDNILIFGLRGGINSYGPFGSNPSSNINGNPITLTRIWSNSNITTGTLPNYGVENNGSIGRIEIHYVLGPSVSTSDSNSITKTSAILGGNVTNNNGNVVTERGIVYSTSDTTPEIGEVGVTKDTNGTGTGIFSEAINSFTKNTTYYYRAYAINSDDTGYGDVKQFTTLNDIPTVTTSDATNIITFGATLGGDVIAMGDTPVTERGIVFSTTDTTPEIGEAGVTKDTNGTGLGIFSEAISGLMANTTYHYRTYATNDQGTNYGIVKSFTTSKEIKIVSIQRQNPTAATTGANQVVFRVTFNDTVENVDTSDFSLNGIATGNINSVTSVNTSTYDVHINNITGNGTLQLDIKGVNGVSGTNDIKEPDTTTDNTVLNQQSVDDWLNQSFIGQSFTATSTGTITEITYYPKEPEHTFSGTAMLRFYNGEQLTPDLNNTDYSQQVTVTDGGNQVFTFTTPQNLTNDQKYTVLLSDFTGTGSHAFEGVLNSNPYPEGRAVFTNHNNNHPNYDLRIKIDEEVTTKVGANLLATAPITHEHYTLDQTLSTQKHLLKDVSVYNIDNTIYIDGITTNGTIKLYNSLGFQMLVEGVTSNHSNRIAIDNIQSGIYVIQLQTQKIQLAKKLIIE